MVKKVELQLSDNRKSLESMFNDQSSDKPESPSKLASIDLVCSKKAWSGKKWEKVATASSFTIVYEKSERKRIEHSIAKTFPKWNNLPCRKYVIYFYLVAYFISALLYLSVRFLCISIKKGFLGIVCIRIFPSKNGGCVILMM